MSSWVHGVDFSIRSSYFIYAPLPVLIPISFSDLTLVVPWGTGADLISSPCYVSVSIKTFSLILLKSDTRTLRLCFFIIFFSRASCHRCDIYRHQPPEVLVCHTCSSATNELFLTSNCTSLQALSLTDMFSSQFPPPRDLTKGAATATATAATNQLIICFQRCWQFRWLLW